MRPQAQYQRSLDLLQHVKRQDASILTKSGMMVGLGETDDEVKWVMDDLRKHDVDIFTVGQYLRPSLKHHDILRFVEPEKFEEYKSWGEEMGFRYVASGPYVRSSYFAEGLHGRRRKARRRFVPRPPDNLTAYGVFVSATSMPSALRSNTISFVATDLSMRWMPMSTGTSPPTSRAGPR